MNEFYNTLKIPLTRLTRKVLNSLAVDLGVDPKMFKTKPMLINHIRPLLEIQNSEDPVTFTKLEYIGKTNLFTWIQNGKRYGADVESLYHMIQNGNTINPWAIDHATGIAQSSDPETYSANYDMRNVDNLVDCVTHRYKNLANVEHDDNVSEEVKQRFAIFDCAPDLYIIHIVDYIASSRNQVHILHLLLNSTNEVMREYVHQISIPGLAQEGDFSKFLFLNQLHMKLRLKLLREDNYKNETCLYIASEFFQLCQAVLEMTTIEEIFDNLDKTIKEINR